jgi:putative transposase
LQKDREVLLSFYDFPAEHWSHIQATNPIESTFTTVRHRTRQTKGCGLREATLMMVWKLAMEAQRSWRRLNGCRQPEKVITGVIFEDGEDRDTAVA